MQSILAVYPPEVLILFAGVLGLLVGSFLNVVIYRLPMMMERVQTLNVASVSLLARSPQCVAARCTDRCLSAIRPICFYTTDSKA